MLIGDRLRALREANNLSQGDIEQRTGLLRPYLSRIENGHTVPSIETLEKLAQARSRSLSIQLFYEGEEPPDVPTLAKGRTGEKIVSGSSGKETRMLEKFRQLFGRMSESDRQLLLHMAQKMAKR